MGTAAQLFTKSMLIGLDSSLQKKQFDDEDLISDIENLPYEEAVEYLSKRSILKKDDYYKLSDKLKFRAFTVGRINDGRLLDRLNAEMIKNVNDGKGLKDFLALTKTDILNKIGMGPNQGWYWETVYRTNVQTAYNVGRAMGFEEDPPIALEFVGIDDARQTDTCSSLSGVIRPYDDPFWEGHTPPLHFNCRSTLRGIYDESELPEKWSNVGDVENAAKGFGSWPTENDSWWEELASQTRAAKYYGVQGEIEALNFFLFNSEKVKEILDKQKPVDKKIFNRVKIALEKKGNTISQGPEIDEYLERTGREATIYSSGDILMHSKISASGFFEELIHWGQIKKYGQNVSKTQNCLCEIEAKEKLLRNAKIYGITDYEIEVTKESISHYKKLLESLKGGDNV